MVTQQPTWFAQARSAVTRFFRKILLWSIFLAIAAAALFWLVAYSSVGSGTPFFRGLKQAAHDKAASAFVQAETATTAAIRTKLGLASAPEARPTSQNTSDDTTAIAVRITASAVSVTVAAASGPAEQVASIPVAVKPQPTPASAPTQSTTPSASYFRIPFYYDPTNAPRGVSQERALALVGEASKVWETACGIQFEFKGVRTSDYLDTQNQLKGNTGIVVWSDHSEQNGEGSILGQAHTGNEYGYAKGFVLNLLAPAFASGKDQTDLLLTVLTHEMGHVIGLGHSRNKKSLMAAYATPNNMTLLPGDVQMCRYLQARWSGMPRIAAQDKFGVVFDD